MIAVIGILIIVIFGCAMIYEFRHAEIVPPTEPFLHDDYDPKKDPTLR